MKRMFVFSATIAAVLIAGVAIAFVASPETENLAGGDERQTTTTIDAEPDKNFDVYEGDKPEPDDDEKMLDEGAKEEPKGDDPKPDKDAPDFAILYPEDGAHFTEDHLAFEGVVEPGSKVFGAGYEADVDEEGNWRIVLILSPGGNLATFTAVDEAGNESQAQVKVYLDSSDEEEPKEEPKESDFVAKQKYGSCSEEVPYDVWFGSGTPGTDVWIASDFGSGHTVVGEGGEWELKVYFSEAPCEDEFAVVVETDDGYRKVFEFIRFCEGEKGSD